MIKVALVSIIKPAPNSNEGITEYAYNLYARLSRNKSVKVTCVYALDEAKRENVFGYAQTYLKMFLGKLTKEFESGSYDIVHIVNEELAFLASRIKRANQNGKVIVTLHGLSRTLPGYHKGFVQNAYNTMHVRSSIKAGLKYADHLISNSSVTKEDALRLSPHLKSITDKIDVIPLGIDDRLGSIVHKRSGHERQLTVGYIGSFTYLKNVMFIFRTAKILRDEHIRFLIYGFGSEQEISELFRYKIDNKLDNLDIFGPLTRNGVRDAYAIFDVFIFPSRYEGFGLPILEAQAAGLPVMIYKPGRLAKEVTKYCISVRNETEAAAALRKALAHGFNTKKLGRAKRYALDFTWDKTASMTLALYKKLLED